MCRAPLLGYLEARVLLPRDEYEMTAGHLTQSLMSIVRWSSYLSVRRACLWSWQRLQSWFLHFVTNGFHWRIWSSLDSFQQLWLKKLRQVSAANLAFGVTLEERNFTRFFKGWTVLNETCMSKRLTWARPANFSSFFRTWKLMRSR